MARMRRPNDPPRPAALSQREMEDVEAFAERSFGGFDLVLDEIESPDIHLDLIVVPAATDRPWLTVVTMGMSALPMHAPEGVSPFAELFIQLPPGWPVDARAFKEQGESAWWPFRWLKNIARLPIESRTWVGPGHTVATGYPDEPIAPNCGFAAFLLADYGLEPAASRFRSGRKRVRALQVLPLYSAELEYKQRHGAEELLALFRGAGRCGHELSDPGRGPVAQGDPG